VVVLKDLAKVWGVLQVARDRATGAARVDH
jgi:hypothetical protein